MYANGVTVEYTVEYIKDGDWVTLDTWERPFSESRKLDETLDSCTLTIQNDEVVNIAPFTLFRLTLRERDASGDVVASNSRYMYSTSWAADATNMSSN